MSGIAAAPNLALFAGMLATIVCSLALVIVTHIRRTPARLLAQAELERARAGLPSTLEVRMNIDLKESETISSGWASAIRSRLGR